MRRSNLVRISGLWSTFRMSQVVNVVSRIRRMVWKPGHSAMSNPYASTACAYSSGAGRRRVEDHSEGVLVRLREVPGRSRPPAAVRGGWERPGSSSMGFSVERRRQPVGAASQAAGTVRCFQEKTLADFGSMVTVSHWLAVSPNVSSRVRLGTPA